MTATESVRTANESNWANSRRWIRPPCHSNKSDRATLSPRTETGMAFA
ncbi:hypothetical protein NSERUTF1_4671 [Nocardia seriolae]|nr:hypothetical protein NSERUTF1_4671 [Nocardia seriolae]